MNAFLSLLGTYTQFAVWQATFWLAAVWILGRFYRRTPWKAHFLYVAGIFVATFTPLLSTIISVTSGGLLKIAVPLWGEPQTLGAVCLAGTGLFAAVLTYGISSSRKLMFHATPYPDRESQDALLRHSKTLRNVSLPILFTSPSVKSPTVWCWGLHPAVLLPETLAEKLRDTQRDAVFLHELSHIIRRDHLTSLFARLCGAVLFWNPLYWLVLWESDLAADESCDLLVLTQGKMLPEQYTETLLRLVAGERPRPIFQFLSRKEKIMRRIDRILSFENILPIPSPAGSRFWTASVFLTALLLSVTLAFCQGEKNKEPGVSAQEPGVSAPGYVASEKKTEHPGTAPSTVSSPALGEKKISDNPLLRQIQSPIWLLDQEAQERPMFDNYWNEHSTMGTFMFCMRFGGGDKWLDITPEQKKKFRFLSKPQEIGVGWFQKKQEEQDPELMKAQEEVKNFIPKGDPQLRRATEEQKFAYVKAAGKPFELFEADVSRQLEESLTPEQLEKLRSLDFILMPEMGIASPAMFDCLGLSDEQQKKVAAIRKELRPEFEKLLDEQMESRLAYLAKMVENVAAVDKETPLESQGELMEAMGEAASEASNDKVVGRKHVESELHRKEFARRLKERLTELLTAKQKEKMQKLIDEAPDFVSRFTSNDTDEKPSEKQPDRIQSYRVDKKVTKFPADVIDLSTPETAYALGNRIIAGDETDRVERLRQYSVNMNVPKDVVQWLETMPPETKVSMKNAEILHVFIYKDKSAMVIAEVVKGEKYNNRLFTKQDGKWFNVGGGGLYNGKSAENVVKMCEGMFAKLADGWDNVKEKEVWKTPDVVGHTFLATFEPTGDFKPVTAQELLDKLNGPLFKRNNIVTGYFRTTMDGDQMVGRICTNNPTGLREVFKESPELKLIKLEPLNEKLFEEHLDERVGKRSADTAPPLKATDSSGYTHLVLFAGKNEFKPRTPLQLLNRLNGPLFKTKVATGYFRTWPDNGRLIGGICTNDLEGLKKVITSTTDLEWIDSEPLTKESFEKHSAREQESLPSDGDDESASLGDLVKIDGISSYRVDKKIAEYPDEINLKTPESAYATLQRLLTSTRKDKTEQIEKMTYQWPKASEKGNANFMQTALNAAEKNATASVTILEVLSNQTNLSFVLGKRDDGLYDGNLFVLKSGQWLSLGNIQTETLDVMAGLFSEMQYAEILKMLASEVPKIVKLEPEDKAKEVDPETVKEIRITFDRDMNTTSWSWCGDENSVPKAAGDVRYVDKRTCVMPVKLEEKKCYCIYVNSERFKGFRSADGIPVESVPYRFTTKDADLTPPTVVKFEPENGATDVDADAVKELRITFDRDMGPGMSWCSIGGLAPEMAGGKWIDKRTSVVKVTLKPGRNYLVGINAPMFEGFRSAMDVPAKAVPYSFSTK